MDHTEGNSNLSSFGNVAMIKQAEPEPIPRTKRSERLRANEEKWGKTLVNAGWTMIPSTILEQQQVLRLDPVDFNILMQLARHWWYKDNPPYPSIGTIAECIGKSRATVQRRLTALKKRGLIRIASRFNEKHGGQQTNAYSFDGLIEKATPLAEEALKQKEESREKKAKLRQPRPTGKKS